MGSEIIFNIKTGEKNLIINTKKNYKLVNLGQALPKPKLFNLDS